MFQPPADTTGDWKNTAYPLSYLLMLNRCGELSFESNMQINEITRQILIAPPIITQITFSHLLILLLGCMILQAYYLQ